MFLVLLLLRLKAEDLPSLGFGKKLYSRIIMGRQIARVCPAGKESAFMETLQHLSGGAGMTTGIPGQTHTRGLLRLAQSHTASRQNGLRTGFPTADEKDSFLNSSHCYFVRTAQFTNHHRIHGLLVPWQDNSGLPPAVLLPSSSDHSIRRLLEWPHMTFQVLNHHQNNQLHKPGEHPDVHFIFKSHY